MFCKTCPFRPKTFIRLKPEDADDLIDFVESPTNIAICHDTLEKKEKTCGGAVRFRRHLPGVFKSKKAMVRAHRRSKRPLEGSLWGVNND